MHVYGVPCDVDALQQIADRHGLRVSTTRAHAFGDARPRHRASARFGDADDVQLSRHEAVSHRRRRRARAAATPTCALRIDRLKNFGIADQETRGAGRHQRQDERAAGGARPGRARLPAGGAPKRRRAVLDAYRSAPGVVPGITFMPELAAGREQLPVLRGPDRRNGSSVARATSVHEELKTVQRAHAEVLLSALQRLPVLPRSALGRSVAPAGGQRARSSEVLCLPLYGTLPLESANAICDIVMSLQGCAA